ncbi:MAG: SCO1664 family protein [Kineosporiaceae bacterium]|nr:SCO1664 family protein [Kineosporiaceae bacterium]
MDDTELLDVLSRGELEVVGRLVDASNATLLAVCTADGVSRRCVYKPVRGERPLWDFPARTLARREVAAYRLSAAAGWHVVPPTVLREGPHGPGSVQAWIEGADRDEAPEPGGGVIDVVASDAVPPGWLRVIDAEGYDGSRVSLVHADDDELRAMAVFDIVADNADRKGGHVLREVDGRLRGVDHGLTFNTDPKLRTVLWGWAGRRIDAVTIEALARLGRELDGALGGELAELLSVPEADRTRERLGHLLSARRFPRPGGHRPAIPWPAF